MFLSLVILAVIVYGYLGWFNAFCELKDLREEVRKAVADVERVMPKATHSVKTEVLCILRRIKC